MLDVNENIDLANMQYQQQFDGNEMLMIFLFGSFIIVWVVYNINPASYVSHTTNVMNSFLAIIVHFMINPVP